MTHRDGLPRFSARSVGRRRSGPSARPSAPSDGSRGRSLWVIITAPWYYSPELNPVERVWLYLRERFLSLRVLDDTEAIIDACCQAWIDLIAEPDRMRTLCAYPWIMKVIS